MNALLRVALVSPGLLLAIGLAPAPAIAQVRPMPQTVLSRGLVNPLRPHVQAHAPRNVFGTIVSVALTGSKFMLRTRRGALLPVDASAAVASGAFSAPLYVGKAVLVNGVYDGRRVMHADSVTRMTRLDASTPADS